MKVSFSPIAANDLTGVRLYLDEARSLHATAVIGRILAACDKLALLPNRGLSWRLSSGRIVRRVTAERYLIIYEVNNEYVRILRILHAHRDLRDIFQLDEPDDA